MPLLLKNIFNRSVWVYLIVVLVLSWSIDFNKVSQERAKYLLGIFYNGFFKNYQDGIVYFDYMRRQNPKNPDHYLKLALCYEKLGNKVEAGKYYKKSKELNP